VLSEDKLFATLDPTTRRTQLPSGRQALLTDTVGFINNLPTFLVAAFRATLEEINEANVLIHVLDITHANAAEQTETVNKVLEELGADGKPTVVALNKVDLLAEQGEVDLQELKRTLKLPEDVVPISAARSLGLEELLAAVERLLEAEQGFVRVTLDVPYDRSDLVDRFHRIGRVEEATHDERGTALVGMLPANMVSAFAPFIAVHAEGRPAAEPQPARGTAA
jgi:GTP-binding protein HflX